jgi:hypothetical protein
MDLNDPRKRLQVLNSQSPSIRVATQPQQTVSIAKPQQQQVTLQQPQVKTAAPQSISFKGVGGQTFTVDNSNTNSTQAPAPAPKKKSGILGSVGNFVTAPFKPLGAGIARLLPGGQNDIKANQEQIDQLSKNQDVYTQLFKQGKIDKVHYQKLLQDNANDMQSAGKEANRIGDTADRSQVVGSALMTAAAPFVGGADALGSTLAARVGIGAAEGLGSGVANAYATEADPTGKDIAVQGGIGAATGGLLPVVGAGAKKLLGKAGLNFSGKAATTVEQMAASSSQTAVNKGLSKVLPDIAPDVRSTLASYIAKEDNPEIIQQVINSAAGKADETLPFLNPAHPSQEWLNNNLPGTHVPGTADPVATMAEKAKEFNNPEEFAKYVNSLEGEEKAVADAGLNKLSPDDFYKKANPESNAKASDVAASTQLPAEDLAAIKAAGGHLHLRLTTLKQSYTSHNKAYTPN